MRTQHNNIMYFFKYKLPWFWKSESMVKKFPLTSPKDLEILCQELQVGCKSTLEREFYSLPLGKQVVQLTSLPSGYCHQRRWPLKLPYRWWRGAWGTKKWDGKSNEIMYEKCGLGAEATGAEWGVAEKVKRYTLRWFRHMESVARWRIYMMVYGCENKGLGVR